MSAIIYTRQSSDPTGKAAGVTRQLEECRKLASDRGIDVVLELSDNDVSATTGVRRPGFEHLVELVTAGTIDTVIVWHVDRLYRRLRDLVQLTDIARDHGLTIVTVQAGDIDLNTPSGRLVASLVGAVATHEGEHRTERQRLAYRQRAEAGAWRWTWRPFGFDRVDGQVKQVPGEVAILREVFHRFQAGQSRRSIVAWLNEVGALTTRGAAWSETSLRSTMANPRYFGMATLNRKVVVADAIEWEPIFTVADYERFTSVSTQRRRANTFTAATTLLAGLAVCGIDGCDAKAYAKTTGQNGRRQYVCTGRPSHVARSQPALDAHVEHLVLERLQQPDVLDILRPNRGDTSQLELEREDVQRRLDDLAFLVADGSLRAPAAAEAAKPLRVRLGDLDAILTRHAGAQRIGDIDPAVVVGAWSRLDLQQRRAIVKALIDQVRIMPTSSSRRFDADAVEVVWITAS